MSEPDAESDDLAPVSRLAQLRAIPLSERAARWSQAGRTAAGRRGIDAILDALGGESQPPPPPPPEPPPLPVAPTRTWPLTPTPPYAIGACARVEEDWLVVTGLPGLHFATLDIHQLTEIEDDEMVAADKNAITLACRQTITTSVALPSINYRRGALRCFTCCIALGYPRGTGSPKNDRTCRRPLQTRLEALP